MSILRLTSIKNDYTKLVSGVKGLCRSILTATDLNMNGINKQLGVGSPEDMKQLSKEQLASFLGNIEAVMFDCDGVLWLGAQPMQNAQALVIKLRSLSKKVFFLTNNSTNSRDGFLQKFNKLGFEATEEEIVGTSYLAALYLSRLNFNKKAYVIGTEGVTKELAAVGIQTLPIGPDPVPESIDRWNAEAFEPVSAELDDDVGAVVVGFDHHFSYRKLLKGASYLAKKDCLFIATNTDEQFPSRGDRKLCFPGTGTFVNAVKTAAGRDPIIMGKPERFAFELLQAQYNLEPSKVLMIGDRGNTDIMFGRQCGLWTLLVMTGVTHIDEMRAWENSENPIEKLCVPDYFLNDVSEFYQLLSAD